MDIARPGSSQERWLSTGRITQRADQRPGAAYGEEQAGAERADAVQGGEQREDGQHAVAEARPRTSP